MKKSPPVKVAMIGLGFGAEFIPIYQRHPQAEVVAICRRNQAELNKLGDAFKIEKRYTDYGQVLSDPDIDFVHINSPIPDHAWMSQEALRAGKHVCAPCRWRRPWPTAKRSASSWRIPGSNT